MGGAACLREQPANTQILARNAKANVLRKEPGACLKWAAPKHEGYCTHDARRNSKSRNDHVKNSKDSSPLAPVAFSPSPVTFLTQ